MDISAQLYMDFTKMKLTIINRKSNNENNTWNVHSNQMGTFIQKIKHIHICPWEVSSYLKEGIIAKVENLETFLEEELKLLGLNKKESKNIPFP